MKLADDYDWKLDWKPLLTTDDDDKSDVKHLISCSRSSRTKSFNSKFRVLSGAFTNQAS